MTNVNHIYPEKMGCHPPCVPVRDTSGVRLPVQVIHAYVIVALDYARRRPNETFHVMGDGWCYSRKEIAPMFDNCPANVVLPYGFLY